MAKQTTLPHKRLIQLDDDLANQINEFRFSQRINTESEAIRELLRRGLAWTKRHPQTTNDTVRRVLAADKSAAASGKPSVSSELKYEPDE